MDPFSVVLAALLALAQVSILTRTGLRRLSGTLAACEGSEAMRALTEQERRLTRLTARLGAFSALLITHAITLGSVFVLLAVLRQSLNPARMLSADAPNTLYSLLGGVTNPAGLVLGAVLFLFVLSMHLIAMSLYCLIYIDHAVEETALTARHDASPTRSRRLALRFESWFFDRGRTR